MESFRGLSDQELLEKLQSRRGPLDDPDNDRAPPEFGEGARARQTIGEPGPSPTLREHADSPLRLEPRQPLRAPPPTGGPPPWSPPGPPEPLPGPPGRLLPLRPQLVALGVIGGVLLGLLLLGGGPGLTPPTPKSIRDPPPSKNSRVLGTPKSSL
ncbi:basic proline-rich protein-like isoform X2 [Poecile atricapillus]|uniref:basic proline-rich protein-like isoform X2 n=1 Tax=Poecile atricapillus TaxID=48891 RepID=UPI0027390F84|nr:basic proline-rich protein-like isoform X2 [Poecile atricapillus]XP_058717622.1 basic proline-rich protein-like isoform X2 [Poecile atricapillus]